MKLNGDLAPGGDVGYSSYAFLLGADGSFRVSPDGSTAVYLADQTADELYEIFRVPTDGSAAPVRVHPALAADRDAGVFRISPSGAHVVYSADQDTNDVLETYSVPLDGSSAAVRISAAGQPASLVAISPDSSRAVLSSGAALFGATLDGSAPAVQLDSTLSTQQFRDVAISPNSQRAVYRLTSPGGQYGHKVLCDVHHELRSVLLDGSAAAVRLEDPSGTLPETCPWENEGDEEVPFLIGPASNRVFYRWSSAGPPGLVSAPIGGGAQVTLTTDHVGLRFALGPSGTRIFFQADPTGGANFDLFSASAVNGAGRVKLNGKLARDTFADVASFRSSGEHAVFTADHDVDEEFQLYTTPLDGRGPRLRLCSSGVVKDFQVSADREFVLYRRSVEPNVWATDLYSVRADGSQSPVKLNGTLPAGDAVSFYGISADGERAVYSVGTSAGQPFAVYSVPLGGEASPTLLTSNAENWITLGASPRLVFVRFQDVTARLYSVPIAGGEAPLELAPGLGGYYRDVRMTPDGNRVVFSGGNINVEPARLYSVPVDGSASPTLLSGTLGFLRPGTLSPDGVWTVFSAGELFSARVDGTLGPVSLSGSMVAGGSIATSGGPVAFVTPDSSRVVYLADQDTDDVFELYSVPIDGSAAPVKLSGALTNGGDVTASTSAGLQITPDGTRVVYVADQDEDDVFELYVVPIDGSAGPLELNAPLSAGTDVDVHPARTFRVSPDSKLVVYATDSNHTDSLAPARLHELFLVPIDRALEPVKLNGPLAARGTPISTQNPAGGIESFEISADSRRVLYSATARTQVRELFSTVLTFDPRRGHLGAPDERP